MKTHLLKSISENDIMLYILIVSSVLMTTMKAQDMLWTRRFDLLQNEYGYCIAKDTSGNICIAGSYQAISGNVSDVLVVKYNSPGDLMWYRQFDTGYIDNGVDISTDKSGNIFVVSVYDDGTTERPGIIKFSPSGETLWSKTYPELANVNLLGIYVDTCSNIYACGIIVYSTNAIIVKCDTNGQILWSRLYNWGIWQGFYKILCDNANNIILSGFLYDTSGNSNLLVTKLNNLGDSLWTRRYNPGCQYVGGTQITTDNYENICVAGYAGDGQTFEIGVVVKYTPDGALIWSRNIHYHTYTTPAGVACDTYCNIYVSCYCETGNINNYCLIKLSPSGETLWTRSYDSGFDDLPGEVVVDRQNNPIITGSSSNGANYDILTIKYSGSSGIEISNNNVIQSEQFVRLFSNVIRNQQIRFSILKPNSYQITLYDIQGRKVKVLQDGFLKQGEHSFNISSLTSSIYFLKIKTKDCDITKKIVLAR